ncbi:MAG: hydantoinase/oxoprolinase family protein [Gaiellales bacterium]
MRAVELCYVDVGGTFTDAFLVDSDGSFTTAKAPSTPSDVRGGFLAAIGAAASDMGLELEEALASPNLILGYGSTIALNALLTRRGGRPGMLVTRGFEHLLRMGRGKQSWTELDRDDRIHAVSHRMLEPLIPFERIAGVTERIDCLGNELVPLYEQDVEAAVSRLLAQDVDSVVVCFLWSFLEASHERRAGEIARRICLEAGVDLPVYLSSEISPVIRELPRANAAVIESYCGPLARRAFGSLAGELAGRGFAGELQVMQSAGGLAAARTVKIVDTIQSGPVGGLTGGRFIGELYGFDNLITTDVGGTSFDLGLVTGGVLRVNREPTVGRFVLGVPMVEVISIGAGGGTMAGLDRHTGRLDVGLTSAGAEPGPVCYGRGGTVPTVTDADLLLGYLDPESFAGGTMRLDVEAARRAMDETIAGPLGMPVEQAAYGIREVIDTRMREAIRGLVVARGFDLSEYHLLAFGGAGPVHVAGYTSGIRLRGILMFPYSSVFSAFGASAADYEHSYTRSVNLLVSPGASDEEKRAVGERVTRAWRELEERAIRDMEAEGFASAELEVRPLAMLRYGRQLNDLIVPSPVRSVDAPRDWDELIAAFEELYGRVYGGAARYPQAGYDVIEVGLVARAPKLRPRLARHPLTGERPPEDARLPARRAYFGDWHETSVWSLARLQPGNVVTGPAVVEDPTTTIVVPPGRTVSLDELRTVWMSTQGA